MNYRNSPLSAFLLALTAVCLGSSRQLKKFVRGQLRR